MTEPLIAAAKARNGIGDVRVSLGEDLRGLDWLAGVGGLVAPNEIIRYPRFPISDLAAPRLRWIHIIGAGIEPLLPLDWLPDGLVLTNNTASMSRRCVNRQRERC